jgi:beta-glucosidase
VIKGLLLCSFNSALRAQQTIMPAEADVRAHQLLLQLSLNQKLTLLGGQDRKFIAGIPSLHIPPARMSDGPLGVSVTVIGTRALLPSNNYAAGIALAASWDPQLARRIGEALGDDARARDVQVLLGPAVNLIRAPQDGRAFEYFGEDPYLAAKLAVRCIALRSLTAQQTGACCSLSASGIRRRFRLRVRVGHRAC